MSLKYLSNFWRSLELPLINCKTELKLLSAAGNDNINANLKITFTTKDKKTYIIVVKAKDLKDQFIGMNMKQQERIKIQQVNIDIFSNEILLELIGYLL